MVDENTYELAMVATPAITTAFLENATLRQHSKLEMKAPALCQRHDMLPW
jgi:hypothetical protein